MLDEKLIYEKTNEIYSDCLESLIDSNSSIIEIEDAKGLDLVILEKQLKKEGIEFNYKIFETKLYLYLERKGIKLSLNK